MFQKFILLGLLLFSLFSPIISLNAVSPEISPLNDAQREDSRAQDSPLTKLSTEDENIDSFDVSPNSGRHNVTSNLLTDDRIIDSNLRLITVNNNTADSAGFEMDRGMRKTDGKVEYRLKAGGGGNQTEYFRDQRADSMDFEESDQEGLTGLENQAVANGIFTANMKDAQSSDKLNIFGTGINFPTDVYNDFVIKIKGNQESEDSGLFFQLVNILSNDFIGTTQQVTTDWTTLTVDMDADSADFELVRNGGLAIRFDDADDGLVESAEIIDIEFIKITGDLDFATHVDGEIEDTWDWEDSDEYFFKEESNISDFDDGTTEGWIGSEGSNVAVNNSGWLTITGGGTTQGTNRSGLSINSAIYKWMTFEVFPESVNISSIFIQDSGNNNICSDTDDKIPGQWSLFSCNLDDDVQWTGTETLLEILFVSGSEQTINVNFTFLYDVELGDLEGFGGLGAHSYVNPNGWHVFDGAGIEGFTFPNPDSLVIDSNLFNYFTIKVSVENNLALDLRGNHESASNQFIGTMAVSSRGFVIYNLDLSENANWIDHTWKRLFIRTSAASGLTLIDYILLTGHWDSADSVIGLYDSNADAPMLNVSMHFFDQPNDPNYPNSTTLRFEIELMDSDGDIAYRFLSDNFTNLHDEYINGKIQYDVLRSKLTVEIKDKDFTRLFRIVYPEDYTAISARIPALFDLGIAPSVFISTSTQATSWQELWVDYIRAPFKEREWRQTTAPTDSDWLQDSSSFAMVQNNITTTESSEWDINIINLDSVSAGMRIDQTNYTTWTATHDILMVFELYGVEADDGEAQLLTFIQLEVGGASPFLSVSTNDGSDTLFLLEESITTNPLVDFSISTTEERNEIIVNVRAYPDDTDPSIFQDGVYTVNLIDKMDLPSNEFILRTNFHATFIRGAEAVDKLVMQYLNLKFIERDIFKDIGNIIKGGSDVITGGGNIVTDLLKEAFRFIGGIFQLVGDGIVFAVNTGLSLLTTAVNAVTTAVDLVTGAIVQLGTDITTALTTLGADIIAGLDSAIGTIIDGLETALETALGLVETAVDFVTTAVEALGDFLSDIFDLLATFIVDFLADMLTWVEDTLFPTIITFMFDLWDDFWTPILNLVGLKAFVDGIVQQDFTQYVTDFIGLFNVLAENLKWVIAGLIFFVFTLSFMQARESNGRINGIQGFSNMINNGFKTGYHTPDSSLLGFSLGRIFIPLIIIVYIALKVLIAAGSMPDIFGGLPI